MRLPNRKPGKYTFAKFDPVMTAEKFAALQKKLERIQAQLPQAIKETQKYAENGDFSENAEYQIAKSRLRGLNRAIDELQKQIHHAQIIEPAASTATVQIGHTVTITADGRKHTFQILGSTETNPKAGVISYTSPLGSALMGHAVGEITRVQIGDRQVEYTILSIT
ncbi:MAG: GreA/GreB family elongation factor [Candidatus Kerfeldbacteria bacterium]|nr:GreA/GreB family elongation factor [Candidatus Kerfeldbacteria bacterium]